MSSRTPRGLELTAPLPCSSPSDDPADLHDCHVVSYRARQRTPLLTPSRPSAIPAPLPSENRKASERGGMINFVRQDAKVKFEVNLKSTNRASLNLSARLLRLAVKVFR